MRSDWGKSGTDSAQRKILTGCVASMCGIWASLYYVFPLHKGAGTALAMLCSVLAGIFLTRWQRRKKKNDPRA